MLFWANDSKQYPGGNPMMQIVKNNPGRMRIGRGNGTVVKFEPKFALKLHKTFASFA